MRSSEIREWIFHINDTERSDFWEGRFHLFCVILSIAYLVLTIGALLIFIFTSLKQITTWYRDIAALVIFVAAVSPPAWFWYEAGAYNDWVNRKDLTESQKEQYRETYKIRSGHARALWAGILVTCAAVLTAL